MSFQSAIELSQALSELLISAKNPVAQAFVHQEIRKFLAQDDVNHTIFMCSLTELCPTEGKQVATELGWILCQEIDRLKEENRRLKEKRVEIKTHPRFRREECGTVVREMVQEHNHEIPCEHGYSLSLNDLNIRKTNMISNNSPWDNGKYLEHAKKRPEECRNISRLTQLP